MSDSNRDFFLEDILAEYSGKFNTAGNSLDKKTSDSVESSSFSGSASPVPTEKEKKTAFPVSPASPQPAPKQTPPAIEARPVPHVSPARPQPAPKPVSAPKEARPVPPVSSASPQPAPKPVSALKETRPVPPAATAVHQAASQPDTSEKEKKPSVQAPVRPMKKDLQGHRSPAQLKFLFKELVKRDFKGRYKRAALGILWSMLSPLFTFAAQAIIFTYLFNRSQNHFISYLVIGNIVFHYFTDSTIAGMSSIAANGGILSKINVPKGIFLLSKQVSCILNLGLTMIVMFIIVFIDGVQPSIMHLTLIYPIITMSIFNIGCGMVLSVWFIFFKDTQYLFSLFTNVLMYFSAIFYTIDRFPSALQTLFCFNPVYCYITCFRSIIIDCAFPSTEYTVLCAVYAVLMAAVGAAMFNKNQHKLAYYF